MCASLLCDYFSIYRIFSSLPIAASSLRAEPSRCSSPALNGILFVAAATTKPCSTKAAHHDPSVAFSAVPTRPSFASHHPAHSHRFSCCHFSFFAQSRRMHRRRNIIFERETTRNARAHVAIELKKRSALIVHNTIHTLSAEKVYE